ncbi:MAG TPA: DNA alkylation repair protein [Propionibacteriaceae bacterium]|nr:DNA alkylation repair protein [Propionibacteriaceae bacterium]
MAEPLKNSFGPEVPARIARMIKEVDRTFDEDAFLTDALVGYQELELTPRARQIAQALGRHLPQDYERAVEILIASLGPKLQAAELTGMDVFIYLPHVFFVATFGVDHFEASMRAQYELTQRFTAEYSIRVFLERYPQRALALLREWAADSNVHVRRLVSEGTRPRLPWAPRLRAFQDDPQPVLELLELLKDDPELYVRRSVANNLNDIGKDNPTALIETCRQWLRGATPERSWLIRHALRSAVKRGEPAALEILGFVPATGVQVRDIHIAPAVASIGESVAFTVVLANEGSTPQQLLVDLRVYFVKANGRPSPKVFVLKELEIGRGGSARLTKTISLAQHTTRTHYPGQHRVEVVLNGRTSGVGVFDVVAESHLHTS